MTKWHDYQEDVAHFFRQLGCSAEVDKNVQGTRATHKIDVWVIFNRFGIEHRWVIECKDWKASIPKEKVLTLKAIMEDVGADKGILVAESGFQPSAYAAATSTNIILTNLSELRLKAKDDFHFALLDKFERKAANLQFEIFNLSKTEKSETGISTFSFKSGVDSHKCIGFIGTLSMLDMGFKSIKRGVYPIPVNFDDSGNKLIIAKNIEEFIDVAGKLLENIEKWLVNQYPKQ